MPLQNRVTPAGELVADASRGLLMGNRGGRIHDPATQRLGARRWTNRAWIACVLDFRDRHRTVWGEGYTELFFLDEVTALSAGHRPCFECRRADAKTFAASFAAGHGQPAPPRAPEMDRILHEQRLDRARSRTADIVDLPDGAMIEIDGAACAIRGPKVLVWSNEGYRWFRPRPKTGTAKLLTPPSIVAALRAGYLPMWHPSADSRTLE